MAEMSVKLQRRQSSYWMKFLSTGKWKILLYRQAAGLVEQPDGKKPPTGRNWWQSKCCFLRIRRRLRQFEKRWTTACHKRTQHQGRYAHIVWWNEHRLRNKWLLWKRHTHNWRTNQIVYCFFHAKENLTRLFVLLWKGLSWLNAKDKNVHWFL